MDIIIFLSFLLSHGGDLSSHGEENRRDCCSNKELSDSANP